MCDYSLEMYRSRPARAGERYETQRFVSGSIGFVSPADPHTAVCMAADTKLKIEKIGDTLCRKLGILDAVEATFVRIDQGPHHDGVRFASGTEITLQELGAGVVAYLVGTEAYEVLTPSRTARVTMEMAD